MVDLAVVVIIKRVVGGVVGAVMAGVVAVVEVVVAEEAVVAKVVPNAHIPILYPSQFATQKNYEQITRLGVTASSLKITTRPLSTESSFDPTSFTSQF